jgi:flavodoxin
MVDHDRRNALVGMTLLPLIAGAAATTPAFSQDGQPANRPKSLVAFFTRTGNTRVVANQIRHAISSDIVEIVPARPYPEDYQQTVDQARRETEEGFEPALRDTVGAIGSYEVVYLGFPIWGMTAPPIIRSFLSTHSLAGKTVVLFITHGGYGVGSSLSVLADRAPGARLVDGFVIEADQERRTLERVTGWLGGLK